MAVTVYLFDPLKRVRRVLSSGVSELIHKEHDYTLTAVLPGDCLPMPGEYLGFRCVDDRFRIFGIDKAEYDDDVGAVEVSATDAAAADMANIVIEDKLKEGVTVREAAEMLLDGTGWSLGAVTESSTVGDLNAYYTSLWEALLALQEPFGVTVAPKYTFSGGRITGQSVDITEDVPTYRGRLFEPETDASDIYITYTNEPVTVLYAVGDETDTETGNRLTIADAVWSKEAGNPADKPAGQTWLADEDAVAKYGRRSRVFAVQDVSDVNTLIDMTWEELQRVKEPQVNVAASVTDLEMVEGMGHKSVRLGDKVYVRPRHAGDISARIIKIERNYIYPEQTKLEIGQELATITSQVTALIRSSIKHKETLTVYKNRFHADENLIQLNAKAIQLNAEDILAQAETIRLHAGVLDEQGEMITTAMIEIDGTEQRITQMAGTLDEQGNLLSGALVEIDGANQRITQMAGTLDEQGNLLSGALMEIDGANQRITQVAGTLDEQGGLIDGVQVTLDGQAAVLESKVSKDGVISSINQTPESVTIDASKINLNGYVTMTDFEALSGDIDKLTTGQTTAQTIGAINGKFLNMQFDGKACTWSTLEVVTGVNLKKEYATITDANGVGHVVISSVTASLERETINFVGGAA